MSTDEDARLLEAKMCKSKRRFKDEWKAFQRAVELNMRHYRCPFCRDWHLTKDMQSTARGSR